MASFLSTLFGGGAEAEAAAKNKALYSDYLNKGTAALDTGFAGSKGALDSVSNNYSGLQSKYGAGSGLYLDALGVNGADAANTAQQSWVKGPGYTQGVDAGLEAINRRRALGGMADSGNADQDAINFAQNNQNKEYSGWLDRLGGLVSPEMSAASGYAGSQGSLANLYQSDATNRIGLQGNYTSGNVSANNSEAAGAAAGAKNVLGAGLSLASLGAGFAGGGAGGLIGGLGSALGGSSTQSNPYMVGSPNRIPMAGVNF